MAEFNLGRGIAEVSQKAIEKFIRQGVYFEQMVTDLFLHFHKKGVVFAYSEDEWRVFRRKDRTTCKSFTSFAQAIDYAYELAHAE